MHRSKSVVGVPQAQKLYGAYGKDLVWAVVDSGIDAKHPHFKMHGNLVLDKFMSHRDFTLSGKKDAALTDAFGHGTRVAGIIAGEMSNNRSGITAYGKYRDETGEVSHQRMQLSSISGMAPQCKMVSLKTLMDDGHGSVASTIAALLYIQEVNNFGRHIRIHGVNLSVGFEFDPEWFTCGMSPLCVEVDRLVRSGVVVVVSAGDTGYGYLNDAFKGIVANGMVSSINDPGNAESAITVGSTHRDMPFQRGVSYFSGKGPTLDGRNKPDLVAPGEKILTCLSGTPKKELSKETGEPKSIEFYEHSGTGLATAHVSGIVAAFLSVRPHLIGKPEMVKQVFLKTSIDLGRNVSHQGHGIINLLDALQFESKNQFKQIPRHFTGPDPISGNQSALPNAKAESQKSTQDAPIPVMKNSLKLMCSYSHKDSVLWEELEAHLSPLKREGILETWVDQAIVAGDDWKNEIEGKMHDADIIVLLVSAYFVASDYCYNIELKKAIERHKAGTARIVPVVVRPADWSKTPFAKFQALPKEAKPVTGWADQHEAWANVALGVRKAAEAILHSKKSGG